MQGRSVSFKMNSHDRMSSSRSVRSLDITMKNPQQKQRRGSKDKEKNLGPRFDGDACAESRRSPPRTAVKMWKPGSDSDGYGGYGSGSLKPFPSGSGGMLGRASSSSSFRTLPKGDDMGWRARSLAESVASSTNGRGMGDRSTMTSDDSTALEEEELEPEPYPPNLIRGVKVIKKSAAGIPGARRLYVHDDSIELFNPEKKRFRSQSKFFLISELTAVVAEGKRSLSLNVGSKGLLLTLSDGDTREFMWEHLRKVREQARENRVVKPTAVPRFGFSRGSSIGRGLGSDIGDDTFQRAMTICAAPDGGSGLTSNVSQGFAHPFAIENGRNQNNGVASSTELCIRNGGGGVEVESMGPSQMLCYAIRLRPGDELKGALASFALEMNLKAGFIVSCVGSVRDVTLRLAGAQRHHHRPPRGRNPNMNEDEHDEDMIYTDPRSAFEILSLVGTLSPDGLHLHTSLGDHNGAVLGGHLVRAVVHTTAEIVIGEAPSLVFSRAMDSKTGYKELVIGARGGSRGGGGSHY